MRIIFSELNNPAIQEAVARCTDIEVVESNDLREGLELLSQNKGDGIVAGIDYTTRDMILACKELVSVSDKYFTSCFVMTKGSQKIVIADGGVCKNPDDDMLFAIVTQTYDTAVRVLDDTPRIAMLSYSTFGSGGKDEKIDQINRVIERVKNERPEILIDGEMQLDAAIDPAVAGKKSGNSEVAGKANVLICPDLNSGNILYKSMERFGGWIAAGPILQGFSKPISDLSRGSTVEDIISAIEVIKKLGE